MSKTPLENLFSEFEELNRRIIELCCNHHRYADKIPDELNNYMAKAAYTEYLNQHQIHQQKLIMTVKTELYNLETIAEISTPMRRRRWYWPWSYKRNSAAKAIDASFAESAEYFMNEILARTTEIQQTFCNAWAALLNTDEPIRITDRAAAQPSEPEDPIKEHAENAPRAGEVPQTSEPVKRAQEPTEAWEEENHDAIPDKDIPSPS